MVALRFAFVAALAALATGCATAGSGSGLARHRSMSPPAPDRRAGALPPRGAGSESASRRGRLPPSRPEIAEAVATASSLVGKREIVVEGVDYGDGCLALVRAAFARAGEPLPASIDSAGALHAWARAHGALRVGLRPAAGDVVFLSNAPGGPVEHVGLVARVEPDGTALVLHRVARGVMRLRVNVAWARRTRDPRTGRAVNDTLIVGGRQLTAGSLVAGYAALL